MAITFDGPNKIISYDDAGAAVTIDAAVMYSRWKDWVEAGNAQFPNAFRTIGGDPLGGGIYAGSYFFLNNADGWRIRPKEASHELIILGNLYAEDPGLPVFVATVGAFNVQTRQALSSLTQVVATGSGLSSTQDQRLAEVWRDLGLDASNAKTITENTPGSDYTEAAGAITKEVVKSGAVTTITRQ